MRYNLPLAAILLISFAPAVAADESGDAAAGHRLAEGWCSNCHMIERDSRTGASTGVPPFVAIAANKTITPLSIRVFLQTPHDRMPDLHLSREEVDNLAAYILSLRRG